jgi:hypothetical protein
MDTASGALMDGLDPVSTHRAIPGDRRGPAGSTVSATFPASVIDKAADVLKGVRGDMPEQSAWDASPGVRRRS